MKKVIIDVPQKLNDDIQAIQVEMDGLKQLIAYMISTTEYVIPAEKIQSLQMEFFAKNKIYNDLKLEVENYIPEDFDKSKTIWNLDFATCQAEVVEE